MTADDGSSQDSCTYEVGTYTDGSHIYFMYLWGARLLCCCMLLNLVSTSPKIRMHTRTTPSTRATHLRACPTRLAWQVTVLPALGKAVGDDSEFDFALFDVVVVREADSTTGGGFFFSFLSIEMSTQIVMNFNRFVCEFQPIRVKFDC